MILTRGILIAGLLAGLGPLSAAEGDKKSSGDINRQIKKALETGKEEEAQALVEKLAASHGPEELKSLFNWGIQVQIPKLYRRITSLLAALTDEESIKFFEGEAKSGNEVQKIYLADVLSEMKSPKAAELLGILAEERNIPILRSTIVALGKQRVKGSVEPLLKVLDRLDATHDRGQVYQELRDALFELTGQDYNTVVDWKKWWEVQKVSFEPGKHEEGATQVRKPTRDTAPEFAGKKIFGKNVVFVIDTSGTMQYVVKDDIPGLGVGDGTDRGGRVSDPTEQPTKEGHRLAKFWTRMEMAKRALLKALQGFDPRGRIDIIEFNTKVKRMEKGLVAANPAVKKKAMDWVQHMNWLPNGNTNTQQALEEAFQVDRSITEIYFLSDGIPSADGKKDDPPERILERVEALNRFRKVKIHTFGYDPVSIKQGIENQQLVQANEFLKKLAKKTGGTFTLLKVTDEQPPKDFKALLPAQAR